MGGSVTGPHSLGGWCGDQICRLDLASGAPLRCLCGPRSCQASRGHHLEKSLGNLSPQVNLSEVGSEGYCPLLPPELLPCKCVRG